MTKRTDEQSESCELGSVGDYNFKAKTEPLKIEEV